MRTLLVRRVPEIPFGGSLYIDNPPGRTPVVWLKAAVYTADDAARICELNDEDPDDGAPGPAID